MSAESHFLDTSALIALMKRGLVVEPGALVSLFVLGELATGASLNSNPATEKARVRKVMGTAEVVLPTLRTASIFGGIAADLERKGQRIQQNDVWIAAMAMERGLPLYSMDGDFKRVVALDLRPCATPKDAFWAVLQNSSYAQPLVRDRAAENVIAHVKESVRRRLIETEGGAELPLEEDEFYLTGLARHPGSVFYALGFKGSVVAVCLACWNGKYSQRVWDSAESSFFSFEELFRRENLELDLGYRSHDPPTVPWLSCVLLPSRPNCAPDAEAEKMVSLLTPCIAWALMDIEREEARGTDSV